jgi:hypothetical protein
VIVFERVALRSSDGTLIVDDMSFEVAGEVTTVFLGTPRVTRQAYRRPAVSGWQVRI